MSIKTPSFASTKNAVGAAMVVAVLMLLLPISGIAAEFPFGRELLLDATPMSGSKRIPSLAVARDGSAEIDLWCNRAQGQFIVVADTITILIGRRTDRPCPPDRARADEDVLSALSQTSGWRLDDDALVLVGPTTLRFRLQTN